MALSLHGSTNAKNVFRKIDRFDESPFYLMTTKFGCEFLEKTFKRYQIMPSDGVTIMSATSAGGVLGIIKRYEKKQVTLPRGPDGKEPTLEDAATAISREMTTRKQEKKRVTLPRGPDGKEPTLEDAASAIGREMVNKRYEKKRVTLPRGPDGKEPTLEDAATAIGRDIPSNLLKPNKDYNQEMILQQVCPKGNDFEKRHTKSPTGLLAILMNEEAIRIYETGRRWIREWIKEAKQITKTIKSAEKQFDTDAKKRTWRLTILEVGENAPRDARAVSEA